MPPGSDEASRDDSAHIGPGAADPRTPPAAGPTPASTPTAAVQTPDHPAEGSVDPCARITAYLTDIHSRNPRAEVSSQELCHELGLADEVVRRCIEYLVEEGLATADLFPRNIWVQLADSGRDSPPPFGW